MPIKQKDGMTGLGRGGALGEQETVCVWKILVALYFFHMVYLAEKDFIH